MSRYGRIAVRVARAAFDPGDRFSGDQGAELRDLVQQLAEPEDAEWLLEEGYEEHRLEKVRAHLLRTIEAYRNRRMTPPLLESDTAVTFFRFSVEVISGDQTNEQLARLRLHEQLLAELRRLDPELFERLCANVLTHLGCTDTHVTRSSVDLGIDFLGRLPAEPPAEDPLRLSVRARIMGDVHLLLFGQAKRYADRQVIDLDTVKLVDATWRDILRRRLNEELPQHLGHALDAVGWRAEDGVQLMLMTTSSFTGPAKAYARNANLVTLDGDQIAQILLNDGLAVERVGVGHYRTDSLLLCEFCGQHD